MEKSLSEFLNESLASRGLTIERLAETTSVPKRYLDALFSGHFKNLPSPAYVRGYLMAIAGFLGVDGDELWGLYKEEAVFKTEIHDRLPANRFAIKSLNKKKIIIGFILVFAIIYLVFRIDDLLGIPKIEIENPASDNIEVESPTILLKGKIHDLDKLLINGEEISLLDNGGFEKEYVLQAGENKIEFKVKRFLGKETTMVKSIIFKQATEL